MEENFSHCQSRVEVGREGDEEEEEEKHKNMAN